MTKAPIRGVPKFSKIRKILIQNQMKTKKTKMESFYKKYSTFYRRSRGYYESNRHNYQIPSKKKHSFTNEQKKIYRRAKRKLARKFFRAKNKVKCFENIFGMRRLSEDFFGKNEEKSDNKKDANFKIFSLNEINDYSKTIFLFNQGKLDTKLIKKPFVNNQTFDGTFYSKKQRKQNYESINQLSNPQEIGPYVLKNKMIEFRTPKIQNKNKSRINPNSNEQNPHPETFHHNLKKTIQFGKKESNKICSTMQRRKNTETCKNRKALSCLYETQLSLANESTINKRKTKKLRLREVDKHYMTYTSTNSINQIYSILTKRGEAKKGNEANLFFTDSQHIKTAKISDGRLDH